MSLDMAEDTPVNPGDDYEAHMKMHIEGYEAVEDAGAKLIYLKHMQKHKMNKDAKDLLEMQKAKIESMQRMLGEEQGGPQPSRPQGNMSQTPSSLQGITQGIRAVEPNV